MKFQIENFRRFHKPSDVELRPLTILVGENSSGKTSFLGGLHYIIQSMSTGLEGSFNREPFFLGAYDQIAHYRGGAFGRSGHFTLGLHLEDSEVDTFAPTRQSPYATPNYLGRKQDRSSIFVRMQFSNDQSQPILTKVIFENKLITIDFDRIELPQFRITQTGESFRSLTVVPSEKHLVFSAGRTSINRNSLVPFIIALQNWMYS
jgi:AAA ATPase domain